MAGKVRPCQHCHGRGKVKVWDPQKKTYVEITCFGCGGSGKVHIGTI